MIFKEISTSDFQHSDVVLLNEGRIVKTAALIETTSEAKEYISKLQPNDKYFYCLVVALGAGEYWGPNRNGDYFPEEELKKAYKTFEDAHVFRLHENKDPSKAYGKVIKTFWNDRMTRVELVIQVERHKAQDILERLLNNEPVDVSMGCKVEYDICSICGHKSKTRAEYCDHLKHHMNEILEDGRRVYAINPNPKFFDISFVRRGADPTAKVLLKVAEDSAVALPNASIKTSEIRKEVPAEAVTLLDNIINRGIIARKMTLDRPLLPLKVLDRLLTMFGPEKLLAYASDAGIYFRPEELDEIFRTFYASKPSTIVRLVSQVEPNAEATKIVLSVTKLRPIVVRETKKLHIYLPSKTANEDLFDLVALSRIAHPGFEMPKTAALSPTLLFIISAIIIPLLIAKLKEYLSDASLGPVQPEKIVLDPRMIGHQSAMTNFTAGIKSIG